MQILRMWRHCAALLAFLSVCSQPASAGTPSSGMLTETSGPITYTAGPFPVANATPVPEVDVGPRCNTTTYACDDFALTVTLASDYQTQHPSDSIKVTLSWTDSGSGNSDYDLYVYKGTVTTTNGSQQADYQSASSSDPEITSFPARSGTNTYTIKLVPYTPSGETLNVKIELVQVGGSALDPNFGKADPIVPGSPRFQTFFPPDGSSADSGNGEFNIGYNPATGRIMVMNIGPINRITPAERLTPALPESCDALWEDVSSGVTDTGLDPILWTEQSVGRTFATNATAGGPAYVYSDDDGATWVPVGVSPPSGGADHETFGSGPYPPGSPFHTPAVDYALYYCSQDIVGPATCQRSDDGGASFANGVLAYDGTTTQCGGLHGHVRVAPDGTVWLPVGVCGANQGAAVSTDAGVTWKEVIVTGSTAASNDPSVAIDADNTVYFCYVNGTGDPTHGLDGHVHVKVSHDRGATWVNDVDIGQSHGIENAAFTEAWGGSSGRAACGFLGTNVPGNYESLDFTGVWYPFVATTYDGGQTWTTVNTSPDDPAQGYGGIWRHGGGNQNRNLLDFNEITVDDHGYVLYGYDDGCVGPCVTDPTKNSFTANSRVARQIGGKSLYAQFDPAEPTAPKRACLSATRDAEASHLEWKIPDSNGAEIQYYKIFRGTSPGSETLLATTANAKNTFGDYTTDPAVDKYYYTVTAINGQGESLLSNEVEVPIVPVPDLGNICVSPGLLILTDAPGTGGTAPSGSAGPGEDLFSLQVTQIYSADGKTKLAFRLNTDAGVNPQPAGSSWYVSFKKADGTYAGVRMDWPGPTPTFSTYVPRANTSGGVDGRFVDTSAPADASSSYDPANGHVTIVADLAALGLKAGDVIQGFNAAVTQTTDPLSIGVAATATVDEMPNGLGYTGTLAIHDNVYCAPNAAPIPALDATPLVGSAPLTVQFDASGSHDPDAIDSIKSYRFNFGDGSEPVTQSSPTISHTYTSDGLYRPTVKVTDSRDMPGDNPASRTITVAPQPSLSAATDGTSNNRLGGALAPSSLAALGFLLGLRRRRSARTN